MFTSCLYVPDTSLCVCVNLSKIDIQNLCWFCVGTTQHSNSLVLYINKCHPDKSITTCHHREIQSVPYIHTFNAANFQRCTSTFRQRQAWWRQQLALRLLLLTPFSSTISPPRLPSVTLLSCSCHARPCVPAVVLDCCTFSRC